MISDTNNIGNSRKDPIFTINGWGKVQAQRGNGESFPGFLRKAYCEEDMTSCMEIIAVFPHIDSHDTVIEREM